MGIVAIATGDILREMAEAETELGKTVKEYVSKGKLVPDNVVITILRGKLSGSQCRGFILDGYPRTIEQAKALDNIRRVDAIIHLQVPEWVILERLSTRRICEKCGEVYNTRFLKTKKEGICDKCSGKLKQRIDDTTEVIKARLKVYERQTQPLLEFYKGKVPFVEYKCDSIEIPPEVAVEEILKELRTLQLQ